MDQKQIQDKLERIQREVNQVIRGKEKDVYKRQGYDSIFMRSDSVEGK